MITSMRHRRSDLTLDVPAPETQESRSWTCPFLKTQSRTATRITDARIETVEKSISELHERVTKMTEIRQEQQSEVVTLIANNAAATELLNLAVNRLHGFYAPTLQRLQQHIVEEIIDVPVPEVMEETVEVVKHIPRSRRRATQWQIVAVPVQRIQEKTGQVIQLIPQERTSHHVIEQTVDIPIPQIQERTVEVVRAHPTGPGAGLHRGANCARASSTDPMTDSSRDVQVPIPAVQVVQKTLRDPQASMVQEVQIQVFKGERAVTKDNNLQCKFHCDETSPTPRDASQIEVTSGLTLTMARTCLLIPSSLADPTR